MTSTVLSPQTRELVLEDNPEADRHCLVCYNVLEYATKTLCQHDEICGVCHLRIRFLHKDKKCPICKTENEQVIIDQNTDPQVHAKTFSDYPIWGNDLGSDFVYQEDVGMFIRSEYYNTEIKPLFGYHCTEPNCDYDGKRPDYNKAQETADGENNNNSNHNNKQKTSSPVKGLQDHLRVKHRKALCTLCVDHQRDFVARLPRLTPSQLKQHLSKGDGRGSGFEGHPLCEFCRPKRFYDLNYLHQHLNKDHYKCHCCEQQGLVNQFFKNYKSLEKHFDTRHFLCRDVQCLQARFVVFGNELDLRHHERQVHGGTSVGNSKIQLEFRVRRPTSSSEEAPTESDFNYNLDGQAFVPENLPQTSANNSGTADVEPSNSSGVPLHPLHVERTARLREQAAEWREANSAVEAFPSLEASNTADTANNNSNAPLRFGWASGATMARVGARQDVGQVTEEAFPTLGTSAGSNNPRNRSGATAKIKASNRQFSAMQQAAAAPSAGWGGSAPSTSTAASPFVTASSSSIPGVNTNRQASLSVDNFPSLGPASSGPAPQPYAAVNAFVRQQQQLQQQKPSINSTADFPPPPSASTKATVRDRMLDNSARGASRNAAANVLQGPIAPVAAKATVEDMKATLGSVKYKELKRMTAQFAGGTLDSHSYVDMAASLFDRGYADSDFWRFLPSLLDSCPNENDAQRALQYMENLKRMRNGAANAESVSRTQQQSRPGAGGWTAPPAVTAAPSTPMVAPVGTGGWNARAATAQPAPPMMMRTGRGAAGGKKTNAWGTGPSPSVTRAKAAPKALSVADAAASSGPSTGKATKFMAKEAKQQSWQQANSSYGKKKKGKQKNELRDLAFGN